MRITKNGFQKSLEGAGLILTVVASIMVYSFTASHKFEVREWLVITDKQTKPVVREAKAEAQIPDTEASWTSWLITKKALDAGLSEKDAELLIRIAKCESGLRNVPNKSGVSSAIGAFQELAMHDNKGNRYTTEGNIDIAIKLYNHGLGLSHWQSSKWCWEM